MEYDSTRRSMSQGAIEPQAASAPRPRPMGPTLVSLILGVALTAAISLLLFLALLDPPTDDFAYMAAIFAVTGAVSVAVAAVAGRLPWLQRSPRIAWTLLGAYVFVAALTFFNVWLAARLMFLSRHDFLVTVVLLVFAAGVTVTVGRVLSHTLAADIRRLEDAAGQVAGGNLAAMVESRRHDEIGELARSFNHMADELARAREQREELEKMRRDLLAWAGHDLRTPLASVRAIVEALADGVVDDEVLTQRYLSTAKKDLNRLSFLVEDLFVLAQLDAGRLPLERHPASLGDLVSDTLESFSVLAEARGVKLEGAALDMLPTLELDVPRVGRVLGNLVDNALRHTPPGGRVTITAETSDDEVRVAVEDTGEGIDEAVLPHLFERSDAVPRRPRAGGAEDEPTRSGLGLAIARGIVEAHGGRIWAEVRPSGGSRFVFALPR